MPLPSRRWTVSQQLVLLVLVVVLPVVAIFGWLFARAWQAAADQAYGQVQRLADRTAQRLASELGQREAVLQRIAERPRVRALVRGDCDPGVDAYVALQPEFNNIAVRTLDATLICTFRPTIPPPSAILEAPWFREAVQAEGFRVGNAFLGSATRRWAVPLTHPVLDLEGRRSGLVIVALDLLQLRSRVLDALSADALVAAADRAGTVVLRSIEPEAWLGKPAPPDHLALARQGGTTVAIGIDGVQRLYAHATVPGIDWVVVAGLPEAEVLAAPRAWLVRGAAAGALVLLVVVLLAWRVARAVIGPIHALAHTAGRVARVDETARALVSGPADVAEVALRFNEMLDVRDRAEAERRALESQLRESQKMEAIGTLAGGIAHDFNNIVGAILGNAAMALKDLGPGHPATACLEQVRQAALRARQLVEQILAYSRRQPQQLASRALAPLVREAVALLRATLPAGVALDLALDDAAALHVRCDATQMQQVLMNLCTNAWHAMDGGPGRIQIGLAAGDLPKGPCVHLWVRDDGCGMDAPTRERIFEPFFTTKAVGEGTGLGLSVVHGIVNAHGGAIVVDSAPGRGSTFHLYFPRAAAGDAGEAQALPRAPEAAHGGNGRHVLVVDDDEVMRLMVERLLTRAGFRVTACVGARDALAVLARPASGVDIVVTDFNMPEVSGLDVARELAALRPGLCVVVSSGLVTDGLREHALRAGARAVMRKENTFDDLVPLLIRLLDEAEAGVNRRAPP